MNTPVEQSPVRRRRTFAIIAHPDAGKTTLTEKLLLFGGAIHLAGAVRARGEQRRARSDWMKIEQARGISVTTSVMSFEHADCVFNLLDTPGHEDFSEDTYRTLTAVDSAVMVIDAAKGIEAQTLKLFEVCRLRDVPIATFVNKIDREGRDGFDLMDEIARSLALDTTPMNWPVGMGGTLKGLWTLGRNRLTLAPADNAGENARIVEAAGAEDPALAQHLPREAAEKLAEDVGLIEAGCPEFDLRSYRQGHLTPVFFGSALRNFGVTDLLDKLAEIAPSPRVQPAEPRPVDPEESSVTGFVFKVQANMDPNHRDRVAFLRLCSGRFKRGMKLRQSRGGKWLAVNNPVLFLARDRQLAEEAFPGDIIGIPNHGVLRVGDTLSEGEEIRFTGIPNFAPEVLRRVRLDDPMRVKHMRRALEDMAEEGVTQVFKPVVGGDWIVGLVGPLQLDVLAARVEAEYRLRIGFEQAPYETARWVGAADRRELDRFLEAQRASIAEDRDGQPVFLARNAWELGHTQKNWPQVTFAATRERA